MAAEWPSGCRCRICLLRRAATSGLRFGLPLMCPKCFARGEFFGVLKIPGEKATRACPNCDSALVSMRRTGHAD